MNDSDSESSGLLCRMRRMAITAVGAFQNRGELFLAELHEEKTRILEVFIWSIAVCLLGTLFLVVLTGVVIFLLPADSRIYGALGFCVLYLAAAILAFLNLRALWRHSGPPFSDTISETKKDLEWLESLK